MKNSGRIVLVAVLLLVALSGFTLARHGRLKNQLPTGRMHDYQLDPPGLADLKPGDVQPGVPVLCYHYFRSPWNVSYLIKVLGSVFFGMPALGAREFWTTPVGEFEKQLQYFRDTGTRVMTLDEVADLLAAGDPLPPRAVVLTIDDADLSVYRQAFPLLKKYDVKAHLFVPTAMVGTHWSSLDVCTWRQLKEMSDSGHVLIDSHTRHLHYKIPTSDGAEPVFLHPASIGDDVIEDNRRDLDRFDSRQWRLPDPKAATAALQGALAPVAADILASRMDILQNVGRPPHWLSWPYGFADGALDSVCNVMGFRGTVSLRPSTYGPGESTGHVGRFTLTAKSTLERIGLVFPDNSP